MTHTGVECDAYRRGMCRIQAWYVWNVWNVTATGSRAFSITSIINDIKTRIFMYFEDSSLQVLK